MLLPSPLCREENGGKVARRKQFLGKEWDRETNIDRQPFCAFDYKIKNTNLSTKMNIKIREITVSYKKLLNTKHQKIHLKNNVFLLNCFAYLT